MSQGQNTGPTGNYQHRLVDSQVVGAHQYGSSSGQGNYQTGWTRTEQLPDGGLRSTTYNESQKFSSTGYKATMATSGRPDTYTPPGGNEANLFSTGHYNAQPYFGTQFGAESGVAYSQRGSSRERSEVYEFTSDKGFRGPRMSLNGVAPRLVGTLEGEGRIVDVREGESRIVEERVYEGESRVVNERVIKRERKSETREAKREKVDVEQIEVQKIIEVIKEKPVPVEVYKDVVHDVIVDIPIERRIEREKITEVVMEKPIEKIMQVEVEQIIEVPVERIYERPIEVKRTVNRPVEKVVHRPYEIIRENVIYTENVIDIDERDIGRFPGAAVLPTQVVYEQRQKIVEKPVYVDNIVDKVREVKRQMIVEVPTERVVERIVPFYIDRPVPVERVIEQEVEVPVENIIYKNVDYLVEVPVLRENIIEKRVPVERVVEREVIEPVEQLVEVPIIFENVIEKPVELLVEVPVPVEKVVEIPVEQVHETFVNIEQVTGKPVEKVVHKAVPVIRQVEVPFELTIERTIPMPTEQIIEKKINKFVEIPVEKVVERQVPVERTTEKAVFVDRVREIPLQVTTENIIPVEKIVERSVQFDTVLEKEIEYIVEREVEVPVHREVPVEVTVRVPRPIFNEHTQEEFYNVETDVYEFNEEYVQEDVVEVEDAEMAREIESRKMEVRSQESENRNLRSQFEALQREFEECREAGGIIEENENLRLKARLSDLTSALRSLSDQKSMLYKKSINRSIVTDTFINKDPAVDTLRSRIRALIAENQALIRNVREVSSRVTEIVQSHSNAVATTDYGYKNYQPRSSYHPVSQGQVEELKRSTVMRSSQVASSNGSSANRAFPPQVASQTRAYGTNFQQQRA